MGDDRDQVLLAARFDAAMEADVYRRAGEETGYWANYFLRDLRSHGGLITAKKLLRAKGISHGFRRLKEEGRLDLTVEALVLRQEFRPLFTNGELALAKARLDRYGYRPRRDSVSSWDIPPDVQAELDALLRRVEEQPGDRQIMLRNEVVGYGSVATRAMHRWLRDEHLAGFAIAALERLAASDPGAAGALEDYAMHGGRDRELAVAALDRIHAAGRSVH